MRGACHRSAAAERAHRGSPPPPGQTPTPPAAPTLTRTAFIKRPSTSSSSTSRWLSKCLRRGAGGSWRARRGHGERSWRARRGHGERDETARTALRAPPTHTPCHSNSQLARLQIRAQVEVKRLGVLLQGAQLGLWGGRRGGSGGARARRRRRRQLVARIAGGAPTPSRARTLRKSTRRCRGYFSLRW